MAAIAVGFALLYFCVVRRAIDPAFPYWSFHYYQWWWFPPTSAAGFVSWDSMIRPLYLLAVLAPLAFLPLGSRYLLFALPGLAEVLLSHEAITMALGTQYAATWCGYLLCALVYGASTVGRRSQVALAVFLAAALAISIWTSANQSPITPGYALYRSPDEQDRERERLLSALPKDASIWSHDPIFAHLSMDLECIRQQQRSGLSDLRSAARCDRVRQHADPASSDEWYVRNNAAKSESRHPAQTTLAVAPRTDWVARIPYSDAGRNV